MTYKDSQNQAVVGHIVREVKALNPNFLTQHIKGSIISYAHHSNVHNFDIIWPVKLYACACMHANQVQYYHTAVALFLLYMQMQHIDFIDPDVKRNLSSEGEN